LIEAARTWRRREPHAGSVARSDAQALRPIRWLGLGPVALLAGAALAAVALSGFDGLYGQDSFAYFHYASGPLRQSLLHLQQPPPFFWPLGFPLVVAAMSMIVGGEPIAGQIVSIASGAAVPGLTILLARELGTDGRAQATVGPTVWVPVAILAGLITAVTGQLLQSSIVVMADALGLATATAGAWAAARYANTRRGRWLAIAAFAFAWATTTRWIYGLVAVPFVVWALIVLRRLPVQTALRHAGSAALFAFAVLAPVIVPAVAGLIRGGNAPFAGDFQVYSWNPLNAFHKTFATPDGQLSYDLPNGLYYGLAPAFWFFLGPVLAAFIVPGIWAVVRGRWSRPVWILVAWAGAASLFHVGAPWQNPRFALAYLPPLAILAAIGFAVVWESATNRIRWAINAWLLTGLVLAAAGSVLVTQAFIERKQNDVAIVRWAEQLAPARAQLLTFGLTATFQEYSRLNTFDLSEVGAARLPRLLADGRPTLVLVDTASLQRQWIGLAPWQRYRSLRDRPGLTTIGTHSPYTLLAVRDASP